MMAMKKQADSGLVSQAQLGVMTVIFFKSQIASNTKLKLIDPYALNR